MMGNTESTVRTCLVPNPVAARIRLLATERAELERRVAARTSTQQDAYRAEIILRVAAGQTDAAIAQRHGSGRCAPSSCGAIASPSSAWTASKTVPSAHRHASTTPTSRLDCWSWPVRNRPRSIRRRGGQTHWSINDLAQYVAAHPELGLGIPAKAPSASFSSGTRFAWTVFDTWMNDRDPDFATKAVAIIELLLSPPTDGPLFCVDEKPGHWRPRTHRP